MEGEEVFEQGEKGNMILRVDCDRLWSFKLVFHSRLKTGTRCGTLQRCAAVSKTWTKRRCFEIGLDVRRCRESFKGYVMGVLYCNRSRKYLQGDDASCRYTRFLGDLYASSHAIEWQGCGNTVKEHFDSWTRYRHISRRNEDILIFHMKVSSIYIVRFTFLHTVLAQSDGGPDSLSKCRRSWCSSQ
jgi:hypothetical protein